MPYEVLHFSGKQKNARPPALCSGGGCVFGWGRVLTKAFRSYRLGGGIPEYF